MKRNYFLVRATMMLLFAVFGFIGTWADETITYASGSTWTDNRPVYAQYKYSLSQQIYTTAQLGDVPFNIKSIGFYNSVSTEVTRKLKIYMVETEKTAFDAGTDWVAVTDANLVFSGDVVFAAGGWNTINLSNLFTYTATKNVALVVNDVTGEQVTSNYPKCRVNSGLTNYQSKYAMNNDAVYDATNLSEVSGNGLYKSVNQLRLIVDTPAKPTSPSVTNQTAYTAPATWNGEADSWNLQYKLYDGTTWTAVNGLTTTHYTIEGLDPETRYIFRVQAVVDGRPSLWATSNSFYTTASIPKPTGVSCTAFTTTTATLKWTENGSATQWQICLDGDEENLVNTTNNSYVVTNLTPGEKHSAKIRAISGSDYSGWSQTTAVETTTNTVIGSGLVFEGEGIPIHHGTKCAITEEIYTSEELGNSPQTIKSIGFYVPRAYDNGSRKVDIYMVSTTKTSFTQFGWIQPTTDNLVFSGTVNFKPTGWINITLSTPFEYDGENNVAIIVDDNTSSLNSLYFSVYNSTSDVAIHRAEDTNRDPATINYGGTLYDYKNLICLEMTDPVNHAPLNVTVSPRHTSATVRWTGYSDSYNVRYREAGDKNWQTISVNEATATISNLTVETTYELQVQGVVEEATSNWTEAIQFTTVAADVKIFIANGNWDMAANWEPASVPTATDDVVIQAAAVIPAGLVATARNITVEGDDYGGGGAMVRSSDGITRASVASTASITIADGGQLRHGTDNLLVTVEKNISGYGNNSKGGYQMLGLPLNEFCWPAGITGMTSGNYDLYKFSLTDAQEWRNYKAESFSLYPNNESGYLYANSKDLTLAFTGRTDANNNDGYYSIVNVDNSTEVTPFTNGWRVISNNSLCNVYVEFGTFDDEDNFIASDANFYKMNAAGNGFDLYKDYVVVAPGEAIFMEVSWSGRLHCSYDPIYRYEPSPEDAICLLPTLPLHGKTTHQDGNRPYLKGDANNDGKVDVEDIVYVVAFLKDRTRLPGFNEKAADADGSGEVGESDIETIKEIIMGL